MVWTTDVYGCRKTGYLPHQSHCDITSCKANTLLNARAVGAIAVTVPTCWYLLQPDPNKGHGHGHEEGHGKHDGGEEHEDVHEEAREEAHDTTEDKEAEKDDDAPANDEQTESTGGEGNDPEAASKSESNEDKGQETPDTSDDDEEPKNVEHETGDGGDVEGVQFKGAAKLVREDPEQGDVRKHIPDAKGFNKKRIESKYGNRLGLDEEGDDKNRLTDKVRSLYDPGL